MSINTIHQDESAFNQHIARIAVGGYDDAQEIRKSTMNRIRDLVRKRREGIPFDQVEEEKEDPDYGSEYDDDQLPEIVNEMHADGEFSDHEYDYLQSMLAAAETAAQVEKRYKDLFQVVTLEPIYEQWLDNVYGVGPTLTARLLHLYGYCGPVIVREGDWVVAHEREDGFGAAKDAVKRAKYNDDMTVQGFPRVSSIWSYSGLKPGQERKRGEKTSYNPEAKRVLWLVADCMINQGSRSRYREEFYDPYKEEQLERLNAVEDIEYEVVSVPQDEQKRQNHTPGSNPETDKTVPATFRVEETENGKMFKEFLFTGTPPKSQGHADNRARRYLSKKFIKHYWTIARDMQGLETPDEWVITHGGHEKQTETFENPFYARRELASP